MVSANHVFFSVGTTAPTILDRVDARLPAVRSGT